MTTTPARTLLTAELRAALQGITKDNSARTNIGRTVYVGNQSVQDIEAPCCVLTPGNESPAEVAGLAGNVSIVYTVTAYMNRLDSTADFYATEPQAEWAIIDSMMADITDVFESTTCAFGEVSDKVDYQSGDPIYHAGGGELCGARMNYIIDTPYVDHLPGQ